MMLGSLTNAIIFEVRWFLRWFLRCPGPKKKPNPLFALAPPVYNTLPDAETIVNTWAEMTKFAATAIGMLLATYCLYWLIQQICTLSYRLGIAVAVGASDDTSRHRKRLLMMTSCQLSPMPSESHLELYTAKSSSSTSVASESKKKKSNNQCNSDPNRSPILENAASPNTSSLLDDGTEVCAPSQSPILPLGVTQFSVEDNPASPPPSGNGEKQLETAKEPETSGKNPKKTDKGKDEKRLGAGTSPKVKGDVQLDKDAKLETITNRLLGENVEFDDTSMFDSFGDEFGLTSHPIGINSNGSFDDVLELVSEGEREIVNRGFQMDRCFNELSIVKNLEELDFDVLVEESPIWNGAGKKLTGEVIVKEENQRVRFLWSDHEAENVFITGSFLGNKIVFPLSRSEDGFSLIMTIPVGRHTYEFTIGEEPSDDLLQGLSQAEPDSDEGMSEHKTIYEFNVKDADGKEASLSKYKGQVVIVVNVASQCGFTNANYRELKELHDKYHEQGLRVACFPCNQFGGQEPECELDIAGFVKSKFDYEPDLYAKIKVNGDSADPFWSWLKKEQGGVLLDAIKWNFTKFLVNRKGHVVSRYAPTSSPKSFESEVVKLLNESA